MAAHSSLPALDKLNVVQVQSVLIAVFLVASSLFCVGKFVLRLSLTLVYRLGLSAAFVQQLLELRQAMPVQKKGTPLSLGSLAFALKSHMFPLLLLTGYLWLSPSTFAVELVAMVVLGVLHAIDLVKSDAKLAKTPFFSKTCAPFVSLFEARRKTMLISAAHLELWSFAMVVLSVVLQQGRLLDVAFFLQYLVMRHCKSSAMIAAVSVWDRILRMAMADARCPVLVREIEGKIRGYLKQLRAGMVPILGEEDKQR